jgi:hypothetical protein
MLDFHVIDSFSPQEQQQLAKTVRARKKLKSAVKVLGYYACNNGIRHGPAMGVTWDAMQADAKRRYGKTVQFYGAIMGDWSEVPTLIADRRRQVAGRYANEPFDMIAYRPIRKR